MLEILIAALGVAATRPAHPEESAKALRIQVQLDRAHVSPGEIDGRWGSNTARALAAFQREHALPSSAAPDAATVAALGTDASPIVTGYTITVDDLAGPFADTPEDMMEKAKLDALPFASPLEELGERFHSSPELLKRLNPGLRLEEGATIRVPNVHVEPPAGAAARVVVDGYQSAVWAEDENGAVLAFYPASVGSEHDPLPLGRWKITGVAHDPPFLYRPELFWDADPSHARAKVPPGPNNPVGLVWIDLSRPHYGIHGTPEPSRVGKTQSHGCIRLANWDALELASLVRPGMPAILQDGAGNQGASAAAAPRARRKETRPRARARPTPPSQGAGK
jgi:lipoprotein-anchoring transpeptidase ErfK/SrfK